MNTDAKPTDTKREPTVVGRRVRELRNARNLTQLKLAHLTGLALNTIRRLETGELDDQKLSTLQALADAFEVQVADLLAEPDRKPAGKRAAS